MKNMIVLNKTEMNMWIFCYELIIFLQAQMPLFIIRIYYNINTCTNMPEKQQCVKRNIIINDINALLSLTVDFLICSSRLTELTVHKQIFVCIFIRKRLKDHWQVGFFQNFRLQPCDRRSVLVCLDRQFQKIFRTDQRTRCHIILHAFKYPDQCQALLRCEFSF